MADEEALMIVEVEDDGQIIELLDGARYRVMPGDNTVSILWYPTQRIVVSESGDAASPYLLTNLDADNQAVAASLD